MLSLKFALAGGVGGDHNTFFDADFTSARSGPPFAHAKSVFSPPTSTNGANYYKKGRWFRARLARHALPRRVLDCLSLQATAELTVFRLWQFAKGEDGRTAGGVGMDWPELVPVSIDDMLRVARELPTSHRWRNTFNVWGQVTGNDAPRLHKFFDELKIALASALLRPKLHRFV